MYPLHSDVSGTAVGATTLKVSPRTAPVDESLLRIYTPDDPITERNLLIATPVPRYW